jgi:hypothetical protein
MQGDGGAVWVSGSSVHNGGTATFTECTFDGGAESGTDSVFNCGPACGSSTTTFACPKGATGTPVVITANKELEANQLPPAKEVVHCTKVPQ